MILEHHLVPGAYLVELEALRPVKTSELLRALELADFHRISLDADYMSGADDEPGPMPPRGLGPGWGVRFVGVLGSRATAIDAGPVRWRTIHRLSVDPYPSFEGRTAIRGEEVPLAAGKTYEARVYVNERAFPTLGLGWRHLQTHVGLVPLKMALLRRNVRLPGIPSGPSSSWTERLLFARPARDILVPGSGPILFGEVAPLREEPGR